MMVIWQHMDMCCQICCLRTLLKLYKMKREILFEIILLSFVKRY